MLSPKKTKYRKWQRGRNRGKATSNNTIAFGDYGLQILELAYITDRQIEAARRALTRHIKRSGKVRIGDIVLLEPLTENLSGKYQIIFRYTTDQKKILEICFG